MKSSAILNLALALPNSVTTIARLWKTFGLLGYVDIFVGKFAVADFLGVSGRSSSEIHL